MALESSMIPWFLAASSLILVIFLLAGSRKGLASGPAADRLEEGAALLSGTQRKRRKPGDDRPGQLLTLEDPIERQMSHRLERRAKHDELRNRMIQAGLYDPSAVSFFLLLRVVLMLGLTALGFLASQLGYVRLTPGILFGLAAGIVGTLAPSFTLDYIRGCRQTKIRRALPDALDVMGVCLEGGLSFIVSLSRVARELASAHPLLAVELKIVERQITMGRTTGDAIRELANRFDLEELRGLASVVAQSETMGSSMASALAIFGHTLRLRRQQHAEELAHKASVKMLLPMLFFIFPSMMVVILGPAMIQIYQQLVVGTLQHIGH
jgi:tight adherence protein C